MTSVYIASSFNRRIEMRGYRERLQAAGHTVTSRWLNRGFIDPAVTEKRERSVCGAITDADDIHEANTVLVFTGHASTTGGYHTETGIAIGERKRLIVVGQEENIFQIAFAEVFADFDTLMLSGTL